MCSSDLTMINGIPWWYFHKLAGPYEGRRLDSVDPGGVIAEHIEPERIIGSIVIAIAGLVTVLAPWLSTIPMLHQGLEALGCSSIIS